MYFEELIAYINFLWRQNTSYLVPSVSVTDMVPPDRVYFKLSNKTFIHCKSKILQSNWTLGQCLKIQEKCIQSWKRAFLQGLEYSRAQGEK